MGINTTTSADGNVITITISGNFDYSCHSEFRDTYRDAPPDAQFIVNLSSATYMDSSALGMLLLLREHAGGEHSSISIINSDDGIRKILEISNFDKLFNIS